MSAETEMVGNVTRFPTSMWERIKNRRGQAAANCIVSGRYLKFGKVSDSGLDDGFVVTLNVMTDNDNENPDRNLCELHIPLKELRTIVDALEKKAGVKEPEKPF
jgi:hypothetical protein